MLKRLFPAVLILLALARFAAAQAATEPASQPAVLPILKLHADVVSSSQVNLTWYDVANAYKRYLVCRSDDGGKTFHPIGTQDGGDKNLGPKYEFDDTKPKEASTYDYRLEDPDKSVISIVAEAQTPEKNLLEAANGQTKLQLTDITSAAFWLATLDAAFDWLKKFLPQFFVAAIIFFIFYLVHLSLRHLMARSMKRANIDPSIHDLLRGVLKWSILGFGLVIAFDQIGVHVTALLTGISIMGLAIGLAAQDSLSNLIASIVVFWDKPFKVGDWVTIDGHYGRVQRVTFRSTRILTQNGDVIACPNTMVLGSKLINHSSNPMNWVNVPIGIPDTTPIERARAALLATTAGDSRLMADPPPKVVMDSINPGAVNLFLCFCIKDEAMQSDLLQEYLEKSKNALDQIREPV